MKERSVTYDTASDQETIRLGQELGKVLKEGDVIALVGELGSGKNSWQRGGGRDNRFKCKPQESNGPGKEH